MGYIKRPNGDIVQFNKIDAVAELARLVRIRNELIAKIADLEAVINS